MFTLRPPDLKPLDWTSDDKARHRKRFGDHFQDAAAGVASAIREQAPVDRGELRGSVRVERHGDRSVIKAGGTPETTKSGKTASLGGVYDEAVLTEYGTGKEAAQAFFYPVARGNRPAFDRAARTAMAKPKG